ncbi:uncharacterized protein LOC126841096 [Adelges cooleyi]|uniref:uncharacterized protein LOC126841096 n=1 Tax=Adelges cooleyi TaxID=133065 RepID=UPI00217F852D|nr:uncharacterized protein LOC126841096 [Adelges cooleyi]
MECKFFIYFLSLLIFFTDDLIGERKFFPNLPVGEYKLKFHGAFICNESINYPLFYNMHTSRVSETKTVLTGKYIAKIPFDDSLTLDLNMAVLDTVGGWKYNAFVYRHSNACSRLKKFMGEVWRTYLHSYEPISSDCPMGIGNYTMNGFDLSLLEKFNFPKQFYYGIYKLKIQYINKEDVPVGCLYIVLQFTRPWEYNV